MSDFGDDSAVLAKRQYYGGEALPGVEGMNARYASPFAAFINQGLIPGQGFPQVGMSAYGFGLPGYGLTQFLNPDAQILRGAGEGEITEHDLQNLDNRVNGYDRFKDPEDVHRKPDPAFPGHFANEDCDDDYEDEHGKPAEHYHHRHHDYNGATEYRSGSVVALVAALVLGAAAF
ncbi:hypothetical protein LPJ53_005561 [Coemansia erecta]|uniref:Uncharacterized protein n=1 Tax=Coemansia erecta TaxID=147472 RepID=A0A9W8CPP6_9FUNG|nr:hypothetical protein LPJ53_005561 [Coemansia erecta]